MGKKGKARQDKFYHLAKETGYRSRAAFKLLQINRRFEFLQKSRVVVDLCAAPGSWMQVARQHMPVSSLIVGIDLAPIKPIQGCIALQEDITTEKCYQSLKKELNNWKADVVLHDGAPNVGQSWVYDAFIQNQLVLSALKLATDFLTKGGWFVTKIFRSKDYQSLMWVLQQLFKRVHSTKPHASRMESAEIFVVCQGYKAPDKLDPKFLDPKYVFQEVEADNNTVKGLSSSSDKGKPRAQGYEDGVTVLHKKASVTDFVLGEKFVDILNNAFEIVMDNKQIANHPLTTEEIKECCKDIKVLGRKDLKALLAWRKAVKKELEKEEAKKETPAGAMETEEKSDDEEDEDEDLARVEQQIQELEEEKAKELKRKKKKVTKERRTLQEKMRLKMVLPGDSGPGLQEKSLFGLNQIKTAKDLDELANQEADILAEEPETEKAPRSKTEKFSKEGGRLDSSGRFYRQDDDSEEELEFNSDDEYESDVAQDSLGFDEKDADSDDGDDDKKKSSKKVRFAADVTKAAAKQAQEEEDHHPLLTDLDHSDQRVKRQRKADQWFKKGAFDSLENEEDEDIELDLMARKMKGPVTEATKDQNDDDDDDDEDEDEDKSESDDEKADREKSESDDDSDSSEDGSDYDVHKDFNAKSQGAGVEGSAAGGKERGKKRSLTAEALALGSMMIHSKKAKRDITDDFWCRYVSNDDNLPEWFTEDERRHYRKDLPITKELVQEYRDRMKEINVRPIKKVVEAKARKKRRTLRRMEKAKKKADAIVENMGMSDYDKAQQIRHLYKKASVEKKKEVKYVVAKKHQAGPRARRPAGVQGPFKMVDRRMKKDDKRRKATERRSGKAKRGKKK